MAATGIGRRFRIDSGALAFSFITFRSLHTCRTFSPSRFLSQLSWLVCISPKRSEWRDMRPHWQFLGAVAAVIVGALAAQYLINNVSSVRRTVGGI